jgi:hypothetical protein
LLQEIGANNPAILTLINEHQEEFMQILQQPVPAGAGGGQQPRQQVCILLIIIL